MGFLTMTGTGEPYGAVQLPLLPFPARNPCPKRAPPGSSAPQAPPANARRAPQPRQNRA
jgi:hypothetical protein